MIISIFVYTSPSQLVLSYVLNKVFIDILNRFQTLGISLTMFPEMPLPFYRRSPFEEAHIILYELDYDITEQLEIVNINTPFLNADQ